MICAVESELPGGPHLNPRQSRGRTRLVVVIAALIVASVLVPHMICRLRAPSAAVRTITTAEDATLRVAPPSLTVMAYNIAHGRGPVDRNFNGESEAQRAARLSEIAEVIRSINPDVVVLNEVDFSSSWSHRVDQAEVIARAAGYPHRVEQRNLDVHLPFFRAAFGNVILSRDPIVAAELIEYPALSRIERVLVGHKKGAAATLRFSDGDIRVAAVHLSHRDEAIRAESVESIAAMAEAGAPLIAAGDFNSSMPGTTGALEDGRGRNAVAAMVQAGFSADGANVSTATYPATAPSRTLDWVFADRRLRVSGFRAIPVNSSDHLPIVASVIIPARGPTTTDRSDG